MTAKLAKEKKKMKTLTLGSWVAFWNSFCQACFFTSSRKEMASTQMLWLISFNAEQKLKHWCPATSTLSAKTKKQVPREEEENEDAEEEEEKVGSLKNGRNRA